MAAAPAQAAPAVRERAAVAAARRGWCALAVCAALVLIVARLLVPDPHGLGTHTQLGLPRCGFLALFGWPCPACGLTTSFAYMARAQLTAALEAHALGALLFVFLLGSVPLSVWASARGLPMTETLARVRPARSGVWLACIALAHWLARGAWHAMH